MLRLSQAKELNVAKGVFVNTRRASLIVLLGMAAIQNIWAAGNKGYEIALEVDKRGSNFVDLKVDMEMIIRSADGRETSRQLSIRQLEMENDGDRSLLVIRSPRALRGSAVLSHAHPDRSDDQWIFLPAVKRVKKITSNNKSGPFLGSDFAYEDLVYQEVDRFTYKFLKEDLIGSTEYWVVERTPLDDHSGYSKQLTWYNKSKYRVERIEYYDKHQRHSKTLTMTDFRLYEGQFWKPHLMVMESVLNSRSTQMIWSEFVFDNGFLSKRDFSTTALRRTR